MHQTFSPLYSILSLLTLLLCSFSSNHHPIIYSGSNQFPRCNIFLDSKLNDSSHLKLTTHATPFTFTFECQVFRLVKEYLFMWNLAFQRENNLRPANVTGYKLHLVQLNIIPTKYENKTNVP